MRGGARGAMTNAHAASDSAAACEGAVWRFEDQPLPDVIPEGVAVLHAVRSPTEVLPRLPASLRELSVTSGKLSDLGETDWAAMVNLETMNLSHNCLGEFRMDSPPPHLAELNLSFNVLSAFHVTAECAGGLASLNLSYNSLTELPRCLWPKATAGRLARLAIQQNNIWYTEYSGLSRNRVTLAAMEEITVAATYGALRPNRMREARYILRSKVPNEVSAEDAAPYISMLPQPAQREVRDAPVPTRTAAPATIAHSQRTTYESGQNVHVASNQNSLTASIAALMRMPMLLTPEELLDAFIAYHNPARVVGRARENARGRGIGAWFRARFRALGAAVSGGSEPAWIRAFRDDCASASSHTATRMTYRDVAVRVLNAVAGDPNREAVYDILAEEIRHGAGLCFTGRVTRLVNALGGFVPGVGVTLSQKEAIQNDVIVARRRMAEKYGEDTDEYLANVTERVQRILAEHDGISEAECEAWVSAL